MTTLFAAQAEGANAALRLFGFKTAAVPKWKKDYRRSLQALTSGDYAFHGTNNAGLQHALTQGKIEPGTGKAYFTPQGGREVYMGAERPPYPYARAFNPMLGVPKARALAGSPVPLNDYMALKPRVIPEAHWLAGNHETAANGVAVNYLVTPHAVPLAPKDLLVLPGGKSTPASRSLRLRSIDSDQFANALEALHPRARGHYR